MTDELRERALRAWPVVRDLVFTYRAGDRDPRDFEAALPEIEVPPIADALFATLAPGRALPAMRPIDGHTYDWGEDRARMTAEGDGILVADYAIREPARDEGNSRSVYHVVVRDDACVAIETGSKAQRVAQPRLLVQVSATGEAIDPTTDAILEVAPGFGLAFLERIDAPTRRPRERRPSAAVRAFERVTACQANGTAYQFAWIVIGMVPAWFDFAPDTFDVEPVQDSSIELVWKSRRYPTREARIQLSSSRNIYCVVREGGRRVDEGIMSMHYTPSTQQYEHARRVLIYTLRWLHDRADEELPAVPPGRVFPERQR